MSFAQVTYDLQLKGGHVIDTKNHLNAVRRARQDCGVGG
jgi:hypothetical protein